jgi:hypothetical protein
MFVSVGPKRVLILLLMVMTFMFLEAFFFSWQYSSLDELREEAAIAVEMPEIKLPEFSTDMIFGILAAIVAIPPEVWGVALQKYNKFTYLVIVVFHFPINEGW